MHHIFILVELASLLMKLLSSMFFLYIISLLCFAVYNLAYHMLSASRLANHLLMLYDFLSCDFPGFVPAVGFLLGYFQIFHLGLY